MKSFARLFLILLAPLAAAAGPATKPSVEAVIERARATIGSEHALRDLVTLQLEGRVESASPRQPEGAVRIVLRRPDEYRSTIRIEDLTEDTIARADRGCMAHSSPALDRSRLRKLTPEELHRIAATVKNWFDPFRADPSQGGSVRHTGIVDHRGVRCHRLHYTYPGGISVERYFALDDGRLVSAVNDLGVESVDLGAREVGGLVFPEKVEYYENGEKLHTVFFTRIEVNKPLPAGIFSVPE